GYEPVAGNFFGGFGNIKGTVALFTGCMGTLLDSETVTAAVLCLTGAGFDVVLPAGQTCCGALARHEGDIENAQSLAERNCRAFADYDVEAVVTIASGCGSQLKEYENTPFAEKAVDISQFLTRSASDFVDRLKPLNAAVCLHTPCSLKNVMREEQGAIKLLRQIPGLTLSAVPDSVPCCGSAGSYLLNHPDMASVLADHVLAPLQNTQTRYLATSNLGCALHLAARLKEKGIGIEVIHPVALLARQLPI
ncbi:MAG: (Fe-S)-binding protein, partial [Gammaproteobacteria bacterium]